MTTPEHREMPLTLAFEPENNPDGLKPTVIFQPSAEVAGCIFGAVNPVGKPIGVHLTPEEAGQIRDHLNKLLLEPEEMVDAAAGAQTEDLESVQSRIDRAVERAKAAGKIPSPQPRAATPEEQLAQAAPAAKRRWLQFKVEWKLGSMQGIFARNDGT